MVIISPATEDDIQGILEIEQDSFSPAWTHGALLSEIYKEDSYFAVAVEGCISPAVADSTPPAVADSTPPAITDSMPPAVDTAISPAIVGFAVLRQVGDDGELLQIAVDKCARGRGVGDLLMNAALEYARNNALCSIFLEVRRGNIAAVGLYKKHGFNSVRIRKNYYSDPVEDAVVMVKPLA